MCGYTCTLVFQNRVPLRSVRMLTLSMVLVDLWVLDAAGTRSCLSSMPSYVFPDVDVLQGEDYIFVPMRKTGTRYITKVCQALNVQMRFRANELSGKWLVFKGTLRRFQHHTDFIGEV